MCYRCFNLYTYLYMVNHTCLFIYLPILGHCCTQFDEGVGRVIEDYSTSCYECPFKYHSNDSSKCD